MRGRHAGERGSALVVALALFAIALGLTTLVTARAISGAQAVVRRERQLLALNAGEAALAELAQRLRLDPYLAAGEGQIGASAWTAEVAHDFPAVDQHVAVVVIDARLLDQSRRLRARLLVIPSPAMDQPADVILASWELLPPAE